MIVRDVELLSETPSKATSMMLNLITLDRLPEGARAVARNLTNGRDSRSRLAAMGLSIGSEIEILQNTGPGPLLIMVRSTRIGLARTEAAKVLVEEMRLGESTAE